MDSYERRKKSDKAKDKAGMPSAAHARRYEALIEKRISAAEQHSIATATTASVKPGKK